MFSFVCVHMYCDSKTLFKQTEHNDFQWWFLKFLVLKQSYFYNFIILPLGKSVVPDI